MSQRIFIDMGVGISLALLIPLIAPDRARAQEGVADNAALGTAEHGDHFHRQPSTDIIVTGLIPRNRLDVLSGTSVVTGEQLTRDLRPTIGDTLAHQPGVSSTSFGPNASRPVLRGFQGDRVRLLTDGIGSFDASGTSVDHAVVINPLTADRIEVLRGPASLIYGSSAIGGVVNVVGSRIPREIPTEAFHADAIATYGSAAEERSGSGRLDVPLGGGFVAHVDGSYTKTDDLRTGDFILTPALRAQAAASGDADIAPLANLRGKLPNSSARAWEVGGGVAYVGTNGNLGFSFAHSDNVYGVPPRYATVAGGEAEAVRIAMKQDRADMRAEINPQGALIDTIRLRAGWADYQHQEIEDTGAVGTTFYNQGMEGRLEFIQAKRAGWEGAFGGQVLLRRLNIVGEEKFLPRTNTEQVGLFTLQALNLGNIRVEGGLRYEHSAVRADADATLGNPARERSFDALSASIGASYAIAPEWRVGVNLSRAERAPTAEELFARGNHAGTQAFELGNPDFGKEKSLGAELTLRGAGPGYSVSASAFYNDFSGYIYDTQTVDAPCLAVNGGDPLDFPCFVSSQGKARHYGFEVEGAATLAKIGAFDLKADAQADYVRATIKTVGPVPRIPPLRLLSGVELASDRLTGRVETEHSFAQNRVSGFETSTRGFTLVNASISWKPFADNPATSLLLSANNLFDVTARRHASVLKDYAPLAGRDIRVTARFSL